MTDLLSLRRSRDALRKNLFLATTCAADSVVPTPLPPRRYAHSDNSDTDDHITKQQSQAQPQQSQSQSQKQQSQSQLPSPKDMGGSHSQPPQSQSQPMPLSIPPPRIATHNTGTASKITGTPNTRARRFVVKTSAVATAFANLCKEKVRYPVEVDLISIPSSHPTPSYPLMYHQPTPLCTTDSPLYVPPITHPRDRHLPAFSSVVYAPLAHRHHQQQPGRLIPQTDWPIRRVPC